MQISFLVISYNEREYLQQAIESCLSQEIEDSEIIIADDGSNDGSIEILEMYAQKYPQKIRYLVHDRSDAIPGKIIAPIRVTNGIKRALNVAKGKYCRLLAGDDYFLPGSFTADAIAFLEKHPNYSAYIGGYQKVWADRPAVTRQPYAPTWAYWSGDYLHLSAFVFRRSLYENNMLLDRFCDDTGMHYSLAITGKWKYTADITMAYRQRSGSIMHESDMLELMLFQDVRQRKKLYLQSLARFADPLRKAFLNRAQLSDPKYAKYLESCAQYPHDILAEYIAYDSQPWHKRAKTHCRLIAASFMKKIASMFLLFRKAWQKAGRYIWKENFI